MKTHSGYRPFSWTFAGLAGVALLLYTSVVSAQDEDPKPTLSLTIAAPETDFRLGDEIPITFTITNKSDIPYRFSTRNYDRSGRMPEYQLTAVDENGHELGDPRADYPGGLGGGLGGTKDLGKGDSGEMTIALNRWCVITRPGRYTVTGKYFERLAGREYMQSPPIHIAVLPRTSAEMHAYIATLEAECERLNPNPSTPQSTSGARGRSADEPSLSDQRRHLIQRLMYTYDPAVVPVLLNRWYDWPDQAFWIHEAFVYYLPNKQECCEAIREAAIVRGLQPSMKRTLKKIGPPDQDLSEITGRDARDL